MKKIIASVLAAALLGALSGCATCNESEINWETTKYSSITSGGYLPDKWAKAYGSAQTEMVVGYILCCTIIALPIGAPLALVGLYNGNVYENEGKKYEYELAYLKQVQERNAMRQKLRDEALNTGTAE